MAVLGINSIVYVGGNSTAFTDQLTTLVAGGYRINNSNLRLWNPDVAITVTDNAVPVAASNILQVDYLRGKVTFVPLYSVTGPVRVSGAQLPRTALGTVKDFDISLGGSEQNITTLGSSFNKNKKTLQMASGSMTLFGVMGRGVTIGSTSLDVIASTNTPITLQWLFDPANQRGVTLRCLISDVSTSINPEGVYESSFNFNSTAGESLTPFTSPWAALIL